MKQRPDIEAVLRALKPFQRRTVDHAFHRLFEAGDSSYRFLVADEVGLGKTLVARGIIARAIDHYWDTVKQIDIIYICSNGSIARANLPKLQVGSGGDHAFALATRLTLLATGLAPVEGRKCLAGNKVNFVSFTPATSFNMGHSSGRADERMVLFHLLEGLVPQRTALMNLLQGNIGDAAKWRAWLGEWETPIEPGIRAAFQTDFSQRGDLRSQLEELLVGPFSRWRKAWPAEVRVQRNRIIGELRRLLAEVCVHALQPDLVIMDEFQRFKGLLETRRDAQDPAAELAQALFRAKTPEGHPVRTLLLSATPYKLYTADAEMEEEDHYADFLATTRFLMDDDHEAVEELKGRLRRFNVALKRAASGYAEDVVGARNAVEQELRLVMARTERVPATEEHDAMVEESRLKIRLDAADVRQYLAANALFSAVGERDPVVFWKSAPYLLHFMHGYRFNVRLDEVRAESSQRLVKVRQDHAGAILNKEDLLGWSPLEPAHGKLRELMSDMLDGGMWRLLWIPPTVPYWPPEGPYEGAGHKTKTLLFSAWNVVPDVVSGSLSYEAERRMVEGRMQSYQSPRDQQRNRLRLTQTGEGARSRHRLLLLLLPCLRLADETHPLDASPGRDRREWVRERVETLLADPKLPNPREGDVDYRWEWAAPVVIDPSVKEFVRQWSEDVAGNFPRPNPEILPEYLADLLAVDPLELGRRPDNLAELLTEVALGSPAIVAARTLRSGDIANMERCGSALRIGATFWRLFDRPVVISLLTQIYQDDGETDRESGVYWRLVLRYCKDGNLQSVLDEAWHLMWEQEAWSETESPEEVACRCAQTLSEAIHAGNSRVHARFLREVDGGLVEDEERIRTVFALRFGNIQTEEGQISQDRVRAAFNSPFRPFLLATTSIGQEGLDFHPWCHRLVHWGLPGNPVDLEQREGRVHRYKGHAVRHNVAAVHGAEAISSWRPGEDLWKIIFDSADRSAREALESDLIPYWVAPGPHRVQRHVPLLPYSKEIEAFRHLKRQLAAYRVVFGQPRQEELITLPDNSNLSTKQLREWAIDLSPPEPVR